MTPKFARKTCYLGFGLLATSPLCRISLWEKHPSKNSSRSNNVFFWGPFLCILAVYRMFLPKFTSCDLASLLRGKKSMRRSAIVDVSEILAPVDMVDYPILYRVLYIPCGAGFLPSTVLGTFGCQKIPAAPDARAALWEEKNVGILNTVCFRNFGYAVDDWLENPPWLKVVFCIETDGFSNVILVF